MRPNSISFHTLSLIEALKTRPGILWEIKETEGLEVELRSPSVARSLLRMLLYFDQRHAFALPLLSDSRRRELVVHVSLPPYLAVLLTYRTLWLCF